MNINTLLSRTHPLICPNAVSHGIGSTCSPASAQAMGVALIGTLGLAGFMTLAALHGLWKGDFCKELAMAVLMALCSFWAFGSVCSIIWRKVIPRRPKDAELQVPAQREFPLTYATLERRMEEMHAIGGDEEVELDEESRFLSWDDRAMRDIVIQGLGEEDWLAFFWAFAKDDVCMSCAQLEALCQRENVLLPQRCRTFQPGAVAFCRGGQLVINPATAMADFMESYTPMQEENVYRRWMDECTRMGCLDC